MIWPEKFIKTRIITEMYVPQPMPKETAEQPESAYGEKK